jgi:hypothetical protein
MSYTIYTSNKLMRVVYDGTLNNKDIQGVLRDSLQVFNEESIVYNRLEDMRKLKGIAIGFSELIGLTDKLCNLQIQNKNKSAILTSNLLQYARMFQSIFELPQVELKVFSNEEEAYKWLAAQDS